MSDAQTTIILSAFAVVLILYVIKQERKSGFLALGQKKPRAILGSKNKNAERPEPKGCDDVAIDSPDFERCATLGTKRTIAPVNPKVRPDRFTDGFAKDDFLGNPFTKDIKADFTKDDHVGGSKIKESGLDKSFHDLGSSKVENAHPSISKDGSRAFPFAKKSSPIDLGEGEQKTKDKSMTFKIGDREAKTSSGSKFPQSLNARAKREIGELEAPPTSAFRSTPSSVLGMSAEELEQAAARLEDVDIVQRTTGGQLNLIR